MASGGVHLPGIDVVRCPPEKSPANVNPSLPALLHEMVDFDDHPGDPSCGDQAPGILRSDAEMQTSSVDLVEVCFGGDRIADSNRSKVVDLHRKPDGGAAGIDPVAERGHASLFEKRDQSWGGEDLDAARAHRDSGVRVGNHQFDGGLEAGVQTHARYHKESNGEGPSACLEMLERRGR